MDLCPGSSDESATFSKVEVGGSNPPPGATFRGCSSAVERQHGESCAGGRVVQLPLSPCIFGLVAPTGRATSVMNWKVEGSSPSEVNCPFSSEKERQE